MGYRFTLETANIIANLTFGKIYECYNEIMYSCESFDNFLGFLKQFHDNMITNRSDDYYRHVDRLLEKLYHKELFQSAYDETLLEQYLHDRKPLDLINAVEDDWQKEKLERIIQRFSDNPVHEKVDNTEDDNYILNLNEKDYELLEDLRGLSLIFERCETKALLLPPLYHHSNNNEKDDNNTYSYSNYNDDYEYMTSGAFLKEMVKIHPGNSCLILQPRERAHNASAFSAFPNFDVALRQADNWPAVLFWDREEYAYVPVKDKDDLINLFIIIKYDFHPITLLKRIAESRKKPSKYILQLSDLHFGVGNLINAERRLKTLIRSQLESFSQYDKILTVITGDAVNSPSRGYEIIFSEFSEYIEGLTGKKPIRILGNHDISTNGLTMFSHQSQKIAANLGGFPRLEIDEDSKTILLLFNSNTKGSLAEGEIGEDQMTEMGNLLDESKLRSVLNDYLLIAVLHHHIVEIPKPDYYSKKWYERVIPDSFMEFSLKLKDAELFIEWLKRRNVKIVLHGHKHIPFFATIDGLTVIGCGSSTGQIRHRERGKTLLSYNWLKIESNSITNTQVTEQLLGAGPDIHTDVIDI